MRNGGRQQMKARGARPPGTLTDLRTPADALIQAWPEEEVVSYLLQELHENPYNASLLYRMSFKHRLADIRRNNIPLYHGTILQAVGQVLRDRTREWDREIETISLAQDELDIVPLSAIAPEEIIWLWYPYIPLKKLTLFEGDPSSGKTYLILAIAAGVTNGYDLPDQDGRVGKPSEDRKGSVLYITAEDGLADTIRIRAEKVGADLDRLFVPREPQSFSLADPSRLSNALERFRPKLVVLDPLQAFLGADIDMHRANEVRPLMTTLLSLAIRYECAVICVRHWTKAAGNRARHRGQGNVDFAAAARSQLAVGESPNDAGMRIMAQAKMSLAALGTSIVFRINDDGLEWCGTSTLTADELSLAQPMMQKEHRKDAMQWLREYLKKGPQPADLATQAAASVGITEKLLRGARERLHILTTKEGRTWFWRLPTMHSWEREPYQGQEDGVEDDERDEQGTTEDGLTF
jgi:RecA/RadA recombinase